MCIMIVYCNTAMEDVSCVCLVLQSLSSKTTELESLKAEWNARMTDMKARHKDELATEREKAMQVGALGIDWVHESVFLMCIFVGFFFTEWSLVSVTVAMIADNWVFLCV